MENQENTIVKKLVEISSNNTKANDNEQNIFGSNPIGLVDFLNLARNPISNRPDARFQSIDELINTISELAKQIRELAEFDRIYLVTKSFNFDNLVTYKDVIKIILWSFCKALPEWKDRIFLVLVNGINDKDKEADDRTLFILYNEFIKTTDKNVIILSNDNFCNLKRHFLRKVTLNFFWIKNLDGTWETSEIVALFKGSFQFQQNTTPKREYCYNILHPSNNKTDVISVL